jgi:hypothetical protein
VQRLGRLGEAQQTRHGMKNLKSSIRHRIIPSTQKSRFPASYLFKFKYIGRRISTQRLLDRYSRHP